MAQLPKHSLPWQVPVHGGWAAAGTTVTTSPRALRPCPARHTDKASQLTAARPAWAPQSPHHRQLSLQGHHKNILHSFFKRISMKTPPPPAGRLWEAVLGRRMWFSLKVTELLIVPLQPARRRVRPSFGSCYVAHSSAHTLEKLNLGDKQAWCYTPGQDWLCYESWRINAVPFHSLQQRCEALAARVKALPKSLGIKLPLNAIWEMGKKKKKANPHSFSAIVGNEKGYCCLVESPIMNNVRSLPAQRMKGIRAGGDILRPEM